METQTKYQLKVQAIRSGKTTTAPLCLFPAAFGGGDRAQRWRFKFQWEFAGPGENCHLVRIREFHRPVAKGKKARRKKEPK